MKLQYKTPYWMKFKWEIDEHPDDQYVTTYNKKLNQEFDDFFYRDEFSIHINFRIEESFVLDEHFMLFGKPSKNIGLVYNRKKNDLFFIYRITDGTTHGMSIPDLTVDELNNGLSVTIVRERNKFIIYKNFEEVAHQYFDGNICDRYRDTALYLGCSSNVSENSKDRWYGEMDIDKFFILENISDIAVVKNFATILVHRFPIYECYSNILCYYNFDMSNNLGIFYDESKNKNFLELIK